MQLGDPTATDPANAPFRDFRERVQRARADGEVMRVASITDAARTDWRAAAHLLADRERWALPARRTAATGHDRADGDVWPDDDPPVAA
jgi:hypothetical protein